MPKGQETPSQLLLGMGVYQPRQPTQDHKHGDVIGRLRKFRWLGGAVDAPSQLISATLVFLARGFMAGIPAWVLICARFVWIWSISALMVFNCSSSPLTLRIELGQASKTALETLFLKTKPNICTRIPCGASI